MRCKHRRSRFVIVLLAAALLLAACGPAGTEDPGPTPPPPSAEDGEGDLPIASDPTADSSNPLGEILAEIESARQRETKVLEDAEALGPLLNTFWADELQQIYELTFDPPQRFEYYRDAGNSACGGISEPLPENAYYCTPDEDEYIAFDLNWFQGYLADHPSGATTFLILAHEWGHAVQDTWIEQGGTDVWNPPNMQELNADCLAGVFLAASIRDGTIVEEEGDADAIFGWLYESGSSPWVEPGTHGTQEQRQAAFSDGYNSGTDYCRTNY